MREFVAAQGGKLKLFYLPAYSPQLNPDEQAWGNVKQRVTKKLPKNKVGLKQMLSSALHRLQKIPAIVRGFFRHPDCQYAAI